MTQYLLKFVTTTNDAFNRPVDETTDIFGFKGIRLGGVLFDETNIQTVSGTESISGDLQSQIDAIVNDQAKEVTIEKEDTSALISVSGSLEFDPSNSVKDLQVYRNGLKLVQSPNSVSGDGSAVDVSSSVGVNNQLNLTGTLKHGGTTFGLPNPTIVSELRIAGFNPANAATGDIFYKLYEIENGLPKGDPLGQTVLQDVAGWGTLLVEQAIAMDENVLLFPNVSYGLVADADGVSGTVSLGTEVPGSYTGGNVITSNDGEATYVADTNADLSFRIIGTQPVGFVGNGDWHKRSSTVIEILNKAVLVGDRFTIRDERTGGGGGSGGGGGDLGAITQDLEPLVDGAVAVGTTNKAFDHVILKDKITGFNWRLEVNNGSLQIVQVTS